MAKTQLDVKMVQVMNSINNLQQMLAESPNIMFNSQFIKVERNKMEEQLNEVINLIPAAFREATFIVENQNQIIQDAQLDVQALKNDTDLKIQKMLETHSIVQEASQYATEIIDKAKQESIEMQLMGVRHADEKLQKVEYRLKSLLNNVHEQVQQFEEYLSGVMVIIQEERNQIKDTIEKIES
ncbi:hypothetical protein [Candidatus Epulonipiscium viviparus]|uniref:hypothetical protein n=1 Tax=Candidatus Epulonipiscium viviparus TaxID=420336 RepID=UPI00016C0747|nr:hypothetical protein [Candidatus Epulopiscium viviparus]